MDSAAWLRQRRRNGTATQVSGGRFTESDIGLQSHKIAQDVAVADGADLDTYMENNAEVADEQLLIGGLRLARVIKDALTP